MRRSHSHDDCRASVGAAVPDRPEGWRPAHGYPGPDGLLRVWADGDGRLTDAIVSTHWRARCEALGIGIEDAFAWAFLLVRTHQPPRPTLVPLTVPTACLPPLDRAGDWETFVAANQAAAAPLLDRLQVLAHRAPDAPGVGQVLSDHPHHVQFTVDAHGRPLALNVSSDFMAGSSTSDYRRALRLLAERAMDGSATPARPTERENLVSDLTDLTDQLTARLVWEVRHHVPGSPVSRDERDAAAARFRRAVARAMQADQRLADIAAALLQRGAVVIEAMTGALDASRQDAVTYGMAVVRQVTDLCLSHCREISTFITGHMSRP